MVQGYCFELVLFLVNKVNTHSLDYTGRVGQSLNLVTFISSPFVKAKSNMSKGNLEPHLVSYPGSFVPTPKGLWVLTEPHSTHVTLAAISPKWLLLTGHAAAWVWGTGASLTQPAPLKGAAGFPPSAVISAQAMNSAQSHRVERPGTTLNPALRGNFGGLLTKRKKLIRS